jgi:hypothetical protein
MFFYLIEGNNLTPHLWILDKNKIDKIFDLLICQKLGKLDFLFLDDFEEFVRVIADIFSKGQPSTYEFIQQDAKRPVVGLE